MTRLRRTALGSLSLLALGLGACSTQRPAPTQAPRPRPELKPLPLRALTSAEYVATAASIDLFVVRASDLALQRSSDLRVRAIASRLRADHLGLASQLSLAGRRLNTLPTARLLPREAERLAWLVTRQPFDTTFVRHMMLTHEQSLALHSAFAERGSSATLRPVSANSARVERSHFAMMRAR